MRRNRPRDATAVDAANDFPVLTDIVEDFEPISIIGEPYAADEAEQWPDFDDDEIIVTDAGPVAGSAPPAMTTPAGSAEPASKDGGAEAASSSTDTVAAK